MEKQSSLKLIGEVFFAICKRIDSPVSLGLWLRFKYEAFDQLVSFDIDPLWYLDSESFAADYLAASYLRKKTGLPTGIDCRAAAISAFAGAESRCEHNNLRFRDPYLRGLTPRLHRALAHMQAKISTVLGCVDHMFISKLSKWGPGATYTLRRANATRANKIGELPLSVTNGCLPFIKREIENDPDWAYVLLGVKPEGAWSILPTCFNIVEGNRVVFVAKNAKTDRTIAAEPTGNSFIQQGIGRYIRKRLRAFGVDLNDQRVNQTWASYAQDLELCTVDLSSASDSISSGVVRHLLPYHWYDLLDAVRCPYYELDGVWRYSHKFSSMGNAFTFELESLIFWAATSAAYEIEDIPCGLLSVYGDDIICERRVYPALEEILVGLGFVLNKDKSFAEGLFYESCGKHFFDRRDVTPVYQKEWLYERGLASCVAGHNRLYRNAARSSDDSFRRGPAASDAGCEVIKRSAKGVFFAGAEGLSYRIPEGVDGDDGFLHPLHEFDTYCENHGLYCQVLLPKLTATPDYSGGEYAWDRRTAGYRDPHCEDTVLDVTDFNRSDGSSKGAVGFRKSYRWIVPYAVI
jgi:hypothetical protein